MMEETVRVMHECAKLSHQGIIAFPEVVRALEQAGVERYHTDLCRAEHIYYLPNGESHLEPMGALPSRLAPAFSAADVEAAVRAVQRGGVVYMDFVRRIMAAGCVGYWVSIAGRCVQYFGRKGEMHQEPFLPPAVN